MKRRAAWFTLWFFVGVALFADFIASDRPIAISQSGELSLLRNLADVGPRGADVSRSLRRGEWALWAPVRSDPISVRTDGEIVVLARPSSRHWLGTDDRGRDVMARVVHGARSTLVLAGAVAFGSLLLGLFLATVSAMAWRPISATIGALVDACSGLPILLLVVAVQGMWAASGLGIAIAILIVPRAADAARIAIFGFERALEMPYSDAARALGLSRLRLILRHALPNVMPSLWVATAVTASLAVLAEAALSFLGFGTPAPNPSWGELLAQAHQNGLALWLLLPPGLCATILAIALGTLAGTTARGVQ